MSLVASGINAEKPLWGTPPGSSRELEIGFIGVAGEFGDGKTLFGLMVDDQSVCVFDFEDSAKTFESGMGLTRVSTESQLLAAVGAGKGSIRIDMIELMARAYPGGATSRQRFEMFLHLVAKIPAGRWRVCHVDTVSEIELGLVEYVKANPGKFGYTAGQFTSSAALMWGAVKDYWKQILGDLTAKFRTVVGTAHMRSVFDGAKPTGKREPKGKETIMEMASLYLLLERKVDAKGQKSEKPSGVILKDRLTCFVRNQDGELETKAILPPFMEVCTPAEIRKWIREPFDYSKAGNKRYLLPSDQLTDDDKARMALATAEAQARAAEMQLNLRTMMAQAGSAPAGLSTPGGQLPAPAATPVETPAPTPAAVPSESPLKTVNGAGASPPAQQQSPVVQSASSVSVQQTAPAPTTTPEAGPSTQSSGIPSGPGYETDEQKRLFLLKTIAGRKERLNLPDSVWQTALEKLNAPVDPTGVRKANLLNLEGLMKLDAWLAKGEGERARAAAAAAPPKEPSQGMKDLNTWANQQVGAAAGNAQGNA